MKKKCLFVVDERQVGGVSVVLNDLLHMMNLSRYDIDLLILHDRGDMLTDLPEGICVLFGGPYFSAVDYSIREVLASGNLKLIFHKMQVVIDLKSQRIIRRIKQERKRMKLRQYDVEIAYKDGFPAIFTAFGDSKQKLHFLHSSYKTFDPTAKYRLLFEKVYARFDHIVGVSEKVVDEFNEIYHMNDKTTIIPNIIDEERIKAAGQSDSIMQYDPFSINVALVGRLHPIKGYDRLIEVLRTLKKEGHLDKIKFHIFGDGPEKENLKSQIKEANLTKEVLMYGSVKNPYKEIKRADLLLLPSLSEAFGAVIIEAFILGTPVMATKTSGSLHTMQEHGIIVDNSFAGLYAGLKQVIEDPAWLQNERSALQGYHYPNDLLIKKIEKIIDGETV